MVGGFNGPVRTAVTSGRCIVVVFTFILIWRPFGFRPKHVMSLLSYAIYFLVAIWSADTISAISHTSHFLTNFATSLALIFLAKLSMAATV